MGGRAGVSFSPRGNYANESERFFANSLKLMRFICIRENRVTDVNVMPLVSQQYTPVSLRYDDPMLMRMLIERRFFSRRNRKIAHDKVCCALRHANQNLLGNPC